MIGLVGDFFGAIGDLIEMFSFPYFLLMLVVSALFVWWVLAKFWWKENPPAPVDPEAENAVNPEEAPSLENSEPESEAPEAPEDKAQKKKGRSK